ncbi:MAG: glycosyltransferase family 39 protein [bacterium]|nr:MAG: glycosyltransferase family 39 protein [bacterium]
MFLKKLKSFLTANNFYWLLILTLTSSFFGILPLIIKPTTPFYIIDPGPAYVANALEFIQIKKIFIVDHPGTPLTVFLSIPIYVVKIIVKLTGVTDFSLWSLENFTLVYWLSIFSVWVVFVIGVFLIHLAIYRYFKSRLVNLFLFLILFLSPMFLRMQRIITPEVFGLFFTGIWLNFIVTYLRKKEKDYLVLASIIAGLSISSKLTFLFVGFTTLVLSFFTKNKKVIQLTIGGILGGFILGTSVVIRKYPSIINWLWSLLTRTGRSGGGDFGFFELSNINQNIIFWFGHYNIFLLLLLVTIIILIQKLDKKYLLVKSIFISSFIGILIFSKYREIHYQAGNILLVCIMITFLFNELKLRYKIFLLCLVSVFAIYFVRDDFINERREISKSYNLQQFSDSLPKKSTLIWDSVAPTRQYAIIRGRDWSEYFYVTQMDKIITNNWLLSYGEKLLIYDNYNVSATIDLFCWDGMILNKNNLSVVLEYKSRYKYKYRDIEGTDMIFVQQINCKND